MMPTLVCIKEGKVTTQIAGMDRFDDTGFAKFGTQNVEAALFAEEMLEDTRIADELDIQHSDDDNSD